MISLICYTKGAHEFMGGLIFGRDLLASDYLFVW
jgi:hypothetical protein